MHLFLKFLLASLNDLLFSCPLSLSFSVELRLDLQLSYELFLPFNFTESSLTLFSLFEALRLWSKLMTIVNFHAFFYDLAETLNFFNRLLVSFFHFLDYLEWTVLFAKNLEYLIVKDVGLFSLSILFGVLHQSASSFGLLFNLHTIVCSSSTFNMEGNLAARRLALHACTFLFEADDTLELESFLVNFVETDCALRFNCQTWDPGCTT